MWQSISKNWNVNNSSNIDITELMSLLEPKNTVSTPTQKVDFILTETSPRDPTPSDNTIKLWPHQEAMLNRIRYIEKAGYMCRNQDTEASRARYMVQQLLLYLKIFMDNGEIQ